MSNLFGKWTEFNDYEGETWLFYFPINDKLASQLKTISSYTFDEFKLSDKRYIEKEVDYIIDEVSDIYGYMKLANKRRGVNLDIINDIIQKINDYNENDIADLYEEILPLINKGNFFVN